MSTLSANDLKRGGIAAIEAALAGQPEAIISVWGKEHFVVMEAAHYQDLLECELDAALAQSQADLAVVRFVAESAHAHPARLDAMLVANPHHPSLSLHALSGRMVGLHSVSINLSYRITLELRIKDQQIIPINVGDHDAAYQRDHWRVRGTRYHAQAGAGFKGGAPAEEDHAALALPS